MRKQVFKSIFLFTVISFLERGINYLVTFALAAYLSPDELGRLAYVLTIQSYISPVILIYTSGAILLNYSTKNDDLNYFYNGGLINFTAFAFVAVIAIIIGLVIELPFYYILLILLAISLLESLRLNFLSYQQALLNFKKFAIVVLTFVALNLFITLLFLRIFPPHYQYRIYAILISNIAAFGLMTGFFRKELHFKADKEAIKNILAYGLPLLPHAFGLLAIESLNRYFLDGFGNKYELGLYSFAFTLAAPLGILNTAFNTAWTPHLYRLFQQDNHHSKNRIVMVHVLYIIFIFGMGAVISFFSKEILSLFSDKYHNASRYLQVIPFYFCVQGVYLVFVGTLFYFKKNMHFIYLSVFNVCMSFLVNYFLFSKYGVSATAYCSVLSMSVFAIFIAVLSQRIYPLPWATFFRVRGRGI